MPAKKKTARRKPVAKKQASKKKTANKKPGNKRGSKVVGLKRAGFRVSAEVAKTAKSEFRAMVAESSIDKSEHKPLEREFIGLVVSHETLLKIINAGVASTEDHRERRRISDRLAKIRQHVVGTKGAKATDLPELDVADRRLFCETHLTTPDGDRFSITGREWQKSQLWDPLDGFKLWPVDTDRICSSCQRRAGSIVSSAYSADDTRTKKHAAEANCSGLHVHIVWLVALQLKRQQGKTTAFAGYCTSTLFKYGRQSIAYIAGSEDQSEKLVRKNFTGALSQELLERVTVRRTGYAVPETISDFQLFPCSLAGATGGTRTIVGVDEARDVPGSIFSAFAPQIYARNGWRCPTGQIGHSWSSGDLVLLDELDGMAISPGQDKWGEKCPTCKAKLEPWCGRVVAMSSAQELDGTDRDWFNQLCEELEEKPEPDAHIYRTIHLVNPKVSGKLVSRTEQVFGRVEGLRESIAIEAGGVSRRKGDPFVTEAQIAAVEDRRLGNAEGGSRPAVAFLDTSETSELTSLVIFEDDHREGEKPWHRIVEARIDVWDPKRTGGIVDEVDVENALYELVPSFGLVALRIDDRLRPWARAMIRRLKREAPWKAIVRGCNAGKDKWGREERRLAWEKLDERILGRTIRLIYDKRQRAELKGARRYHGTDGGMDIREPKRRIRHLDVAEGVASCCLMVHEISQRGQRRGMAEMQRRSSSVRKIRRGGLSSGRMRGGWY